VSQCPLQQNKDFNIMQDVADPDNDASQCPLQQNKDFNWWGWFSPSSSLRSSQCPLQQNKDFNLPPALTALATASQCPLQQNKDFNGLSSSS